MKLYAIGDIHGCYNALVELLKMIEQDRNGEPAKIVFLGDYTDRGPESYNVVQLLIDLQGKDDPNTEYVFIRGNHDEMFMDWVIGLEKNEGIFMYNGGYETTKSYLEAGAKLRDHLKFFQSTKLMHQHGEYLFVHAGIDPGYALDKQASSTLLWAREFNDYSDKYPEEVKVIHGHTPIRGVPQWIGDQLNIDTGCVFRWRGWDEYEGLTAVRLDGGKEGIFLRTREPVAGYSQ